MTTSPEHEVVSNPDYTVGQWVKGDLTAGPTTKPVFIEEGDAPLGFTVPVRLPVLNPGYTVPEIEVEGIVFLSDPWTDADIWIDALIWSEEIVGGFGIGFSQGFRIV
jgi:hypothetical protein